MKQLLETVVRTLLAALGVAAFGWLLFHSLKRAADPARVVFNWILSVVLVSGELFLIHRLRGSFSGGIAVDFGPAAVIAGSAALCGIILSVIWAPNLGAWLVRPLTGVIDGGDEEPELRPFYSIAQARRMRGDYAGAIAEIRKQLERFPDDVDGQVLLAEVQAVNLNDLPGAVLTIQQLIAQSGHTPAHVAFALNSLADWHLKLAQDRTAARQSLQQIIELLPDTEWSNIAAQRIAHLGGSELLPGPSERRRIKIVPGVQNLGLLPPGQLPGAPEIDPATLAGDLVRHLQEHPLDTDAREKLAVIYADHYGRLNLAVDQLEQLIGSPNQPMNKVVHWFNLLADLQIRHDADYETIRRTLQRIGERFPKTAAASVAENRIVRLKLELKGKGQPRTVVLGTYEQDLGLKQRPARQP